MLPPFSLRKTEPGLLKVQRKGWDEFTRGLNYLFLQEELTSTSVEHIIVNPNAAYDKFKDKRVGTKGLGEAGLEVRVGSVGGLEDFCPWGLLPWMLRKGFPQPPPWRFWWESSPSLAGLASSGVSFS